MSPLFGLLLIPIAIKKGRVGHETWFCVILNQIHVTLTCRETSSNLLTRTLRVKSDFLHFLCFVNNNNTTAAQLDHHTTIRYQEQCNHNTLFHNNNNNTAATKLLQYQKQCNNFVFSWIKFMWHSHIGERRPIYSHIHWAKSDFMNFLSFVSNTTTRLQHSLTTTQQ